MFSNADRAIATSALPKDFTQIFFNSGGVTPVGGNGLLIGTFATRLPQGYQYIYYDKNTALRDIGEALEAGYGTYTMALAGYVPFVQAGSSPVASVGKRFLFGSHSETAVLLRTNGATAALPMLVEISQIVDKKFVGGNCRCDLIETNTNGTEPVVIGTFAAGLLGTNPDGGVKRVFHLKKVITRDKIYTTVYALPTTPMDSFRFTGKTKINTPNFVCRTANFASSDAGKVFRCALFPSPDAQYSDGILNVASGVVSMSSNTAHFNTGTIVGKRIWCDDVPFSAVVSRIGSDTAVLFDGLPTSVLNAILALPSRNNLNFKIMNRNTPTTILSVTNPNLVVLSANASATQVGVPFVIVGRLPVSIGDITYHIKTSPLLSEG